MRDQDQRSIRIPLDWVIVDTLGAVLAGAGAYGLLAGPGGALSILAKPGVAWLCIAFGVGMMGLALAQILKRIIQQGSHHRGARPPRAKN